MLCIHSSFITRHDNEHKNTSVTHETAVARLLQLQTIKGLLFPGLAGPGPGGTGSLALRGHEPDRGSTESAAVHLPLRPAVQYIQLSRRQQCLGPTAGAIPQDSQAQPPDHGLPLISCARFGLEVTVSQQKTRTVSLRSASMQRLIQEKICAVSIFLWRAYFFMQVEVSPFVEEKCVQATAM